MQLLRITEDSTPLTQDHLRKLERRVAELVGQEVELGGIDSVYVAYAGEGYALAAADVVFWPLRQLSQTPVHLVSADELVYHTLAYHQERPLVILFSEPGAENMTARVASTASIMGSTTIIVSPPLPPQLQGALKGATLVEIEEKDQPLAFILVAAKYAALLAPRLSEIHVRAKRVHDEYSAVYEAMPGLFERYSDELAEARNLLDNPGLEVYASPTTMPAAVLLCWRLGGAGCSSHTLSALLTSRSRVDCIVFSTDVEADTAREAVFRSRTLAGRRLVHFTLHTDPLTAPLYSALLAEALVRGTRG